MVQINNSFADANYFPYTAGLLQAYFQKHSRFSKSFKFMEPVFERRSVTEIATRIQEADIIAFSTYVWNHQISLETAKLVKEKSPDTLVLFGGPHVPDMAEQFLRSHPYIDIACHGEGEICFLSILENYYSRNWKVLPSVSYIEKGTFKNNPAAGRIKDLSKIPSPYLEGVFDDLIIKYGKQQWLGLWETNRGCPFSCTYCDWGSATKSKLYAFDLERLKREIDWFAKNKTEFIFCNDSNFGIMQRDRDLVEYIAKVKKECGYPKALSVQNTKNSTDRSYTIHKLLSDAGLNKGVNLALQTLDKTALKNIGRQNISLMSFQELQKRFNRNNVETFTDLILALPGETYDSFANGVSKIIETGQHNRIQFINLSILPNAPMADSEYIKNYGMIVVETNSINMHGSMSSDSDTVNELQKLVVGTSTMPKKDWVKTRMFSWMTSLLYFDKILQIPFILLHEIYGISYRELIELFLNSELDNYPTISEINSFFLHEAVKIQNGGAEFCKSSKWLNIYWPQDEYILIKLNFEEKLDCFYDEAKLLINKTTHDMGIARSPVINESFLLNYNLIKRPFQTDDLIINTSHNLWDFYQFVLKGKDHRLLNGGFKYHIDRSTEKWNSWDEWFREVVWYGNKKGTYLYKVQSVYN